MNTNFSLSELEDKYAVFKPGQLLNHEQLNSVVQFLEEQDKLTRTCLTGVGVVCGLECSHSATEENNVLVKKGCAVTTDGDLIKLQEDRTLKYFRTITNNTYPNFIGNNVGDESIIWELTDKPTAGFDSVVGLSSGSMTDKVIVLFLDVEEKDASTCTDATCDSLGSFVEYNLRFLAIPKSQVETTLIFNDSVYNESNEKDQVVLDLPLLSTPRLILTPPNTQGFNEITNAFQNVVESCFDGGGVEGNYIDIALENLQTKFGTILDLEGSISNNWKTTITNKAEIINPSIYDRNNRQYVYDWIKDITSTYNELRDTLTEAYFVCCPDVEAFPKHIMLGTPSVALKRHDFYPAKPLVHTNDTLEHARFLYRKINTLIGDLQIPVSDGTTTIKVTPSNDYDHPLSERAIPFYYGNDATLRSDWSFDKTKNSLSDRINGYFPSGNTLTDEPFKYNIDSSDFFRIEGHIGKNYKTAVEELTSIRQEKNIPFDIVTVELDESATPSLKSLAKYMNENPGLEHKAGVHRGGTFVMVHVKANGSGNSTDPKVTYSSEDDYTGMSYVNPEMVVADFCLPYMCCGGAIESTGSTGIDVFLSDAQGAGVRLEQTGANTYLRDMYFCKDTARVVTYTLDFKPKGGTFVGGINVVSTGSVEYDSYRFGITQSPNGQATDVTYEVGGELITITFNSIPLDSSFSITDIGTYYNYVEDDVLTIPSNLPRNIDFTASDSSMDSYDWEISTAQPRIGGGVNFTIKSFFSDTYPDARPHVINNAKLGTVISLVLKIKLTVTKDGLTCSTIKYLDYEHLLQGQLLDLAPLIPPSTPTTDDSPFIKVVETIATGISEGIGSAAFSEMNENPEDDYVYRVAGADDDIKDISIEAIKSWIFNMMSSTKAKKARQENSLEQRLNDAGYLSNPTISEMVNALNNNNPVYNATYNSWTNTLSTQGMTSDPLVSELLNEFYNRNLVNDTSSLSLEDRLNEAGYLSHATIQEMVNALNANNPIDKTTYDNWGVTLSNDGFEQNSLLVEFFTEFYNRSLVHESLEYRLNDEGLLSNTTVLEMLDNLNGEIVVDVSIYDAWIVDLDSNNLNTQPLVMELKEELFIGNLIDMSSITIDDKLERTGLLNNSTISDILNQLNAGNMIDVSVHDGWITILDNQGFKGNSFVMELLTEFYTRNLVDTSSNNS